MWWALPAGCPGLRGVPRLPCQPAPPSVMVLGYWGLWWPLCGLGNENYAVSTRAFGPLRPRDREIQGALASENRSLEPGLQAQWPCQHVQSGHKSIAHPVHPTDGPLSRPNPRRWLRVCDLMLQ